MPSLDIANPRERAIVRVADWITTPLGWSTPRPLDHPTRVLLLRLERIGDLLMTLEAIGDVQRAWPSARIDVAVGSWNRELAAMIPGVSAVHDADVPWLSRGERPTTWRSLTRAARAWRKERYDLVINFEPDIRTNILAWLTGAPHRAGWVSGGGGALLTRRLSYDTSAHVSHNARRLVASLSGPNVAAPERPSARLAVPPAALAAVEQTFGALPRPWIGVHASGGRLSKQWHLDRFAEAARELARRTGGAIILTGGPTDVSLVASVAGLLPGVPLLSIAGATALPDLVASIAALDILVTGDTGPMHVAGAVNTPVVALFGPSDPARYGPRAARERVLRVDLPCSPCGQVRLPPERCRGHVPDCMDGISVESVVGAALDLLGESRVRP